MDLFEVHETNRESNAVIKKLITLPEEHYIQNSRTWRKVEHIENSDKVTFMLQIILIFYEKSQKKTSFPSRQPRVERLQRKNEEGEKS